MKVCLRENCKYVHILAVTAASRPPLRALGRSHRHHLVCLSDAGSMSRVVLYRPRCDNGPAGTRRKKKEEQKKSRRKSEMGLSGTGDNKSNAPRNSQLGLFAACLLIFHWCSCCLLSILSLFDPGLKRFELGRSLVVRQILAYNAETESLLYDCSSQANQHLLLKYAYTKTLPQQTRAHTHSLDERS